jgi:hypothetical protein
MKNRTVIVILTTAALLLVYILLFDKNFQTSSEYLQRKERLFTKFNKAFVDKLKIEIKGKKSFILNKISSIDKGGQQWEIETGNRKYRADLAEVTSILSAMDFLIKERTIKDSVKNSQFGLTPPLIKCTFWQKGKATSFAIGNHDLSGKKVYVSLKNNNKIIYVNDIDFLHSQNKTIQDLREKHLFNSSFDKTKNIKIKSADSQFQFKRADILKPWKVIFNGQPVLASKDKINNILLALANTKAISFKNKEASKGSGYGIDNPQYIIETVSFDGIKNKLLMGSACEPNGIYALAGNSEDIACINRDIVSKISGGIKNYLEKHPGVFTVDDVEKINIEQNGLSIIIDKTPDFTWSVRGQDEKYTDQLSVNRLIKLFTDKTADKIILSNENIALTSNPFAHVLFSLDSGQGKRDFSLYKTMGDKSIMLIARKGENLFLETSANLFDSIWASPLAFKAKTITNGKKADIISFKLSGSQPQTLLKKDGIWWITEPVSIMADRVLVKKITDMISETKVEKWITKTTLPEQGFKNPFAAISAVFKNDNKENPANGFELEIGAIADSSGMSRFAHIKGNNNAVFTIAKEYWSLLTHPLARRDFTFIDAAQVTGINIKGADGSFSATLQGNKWITGRGDGDNLFIKQVLINFAAAKAIRAYCFNPLIENPLLKVSFTYKNIHSGENDSDTQKESSVFIIGSETENLQEEGYMAYKEGQQVGYIIPARIVEDLTSLKNKGKNR